MMPGRSIQCKVTALRPMIDLQICGFEKLSNLALKASPGSDLTLLLYLEWLDVPIEERN